MWAERLGGDRFRIHNTPFYAFDASYLDVVVAVPETPEPGDPPNSIFFTFQEAQQFMRVSHQTLYNLMKQGLPSHKIGRKRVFLREELIQWIREH